MITFGAPQEVLDEERNLEEQITENRNTTFLNEEKFIEALFLEFQKSYDNTQPGQIYPRWFDQEELTRILIVVKTFIK